MKNLNILIFKDFFLSRTFLKKVKQVINSSISFFWTIINFKVVLQKFFGLANLMKPQVFYIYELLEVIIDNKAKTSYL